MTTDEIIEGCTKEYEQHLHNLRKSIEILNADKARSLGSFTEDTAPPDVKDKLKRDMDGWVERWGPNGSKARALVQNHQKQMYKNAKQQEIAKDLTADGDQTKDKSRNSGRGR